MERKGGQRAGGSGLIGGSAHVSLRILPTLMSVMISHSSSSALKSSNTFQVLLLMLLRALQEYALWHESIWFFYICMQYSDNLTTENLFIMSC